MSAAIENYLGFPRGLSGSDLAHRAITQDLEPEPDRADEVAQVGQVLHLESVELLLGAPDGRRCGQPAAMSAPPNHKPPSSKPLGQRPPLGLSPRPGIMDIEPYVGGKSKIAGRDAVIKLSSNESALGPSPRALERAMPKGRPAS